MRYYPSTREGLLNSAINKLPFELHIPSYNYCGPGTKLNKRLARGDKGVNELDEACKEHDIAYNQEKDLKHRHEADKILAEKALARYRSRDASFGEKLSALGVAGAMKAKIKLGMGHNFHESKIICSKTIDCLKKIKKITDTCINNVNNINQFKSTQPKLNKNRRKKNQNVDNDKKLSPLPNDDNDNISKKGIKSFKRKFKDNDNGDSMDTTITPFKMSVSKRLRLKSNRKRKINFPDEITGELPLKKMKVESKKRKLNDDNDNENENILNIEEEPFKKQKLF